MKLSQCIHFYKKICISKDKEFVAINNAGYMRKANCTIMVCQLSVGTFSNTTPRHICQENSNVKRYPPHPDFIPALFTIAKTPECPSTDEWIKMWYIHIMKHYSGIKSNEIMPLAATWVGGPGDCHTK